MSERQFSQVEEHENLPLRDGHAGQRIVHPADVLGEIFDLVVGGRYVVEIDQPRLRLGVGLPQPIHHRAARDPE